jgi:hypothetical protein
MRFLSNPATPTAVLIAVGYTKRVTSNSFLEIRNRFLFSSAPKQSFHDSAYATRDDWMPVTKHMRNSNIFKIQAGYFELPG